MSVREHALLEDHSIQSERVAPDPTEGRIQRCNKVLYTVCTVTFSTVEAQVHSLSSTPPSPVLPTTQSPCARGAPSHLRHAYVHLHGPQGVPQREAEALLRGVEHEQAEVLVPHGEARRTDDGGLAVALAAHLLLPQLEDHKEEGKGKKGMPWQTYVRGGTKDGVLCSSDPSWKMTNGMTCCRKDPKEENNYKGHRYIKMLVNQL